MIGQYGARKEKGASKKVLKLPGEKERVTNERLGRYVEPWLMQEKYPYSRVNVV
jgi:hypothetical protein